MPRPAIITRLRPPVLRARKRRQGRGASCPPRRSNNGTDIQRTIRRTPSANSTSPRIAFATNRSSARVAPCHLDGALLKGYLAPRAAKHAPVALIVPRDRRQL